jgi:hypothetical protein
MGPFGGYAVLCAFASVPDVVEERLDLGEILVDLQASLRARNISE